MTERNPIPDCLSHLRQLTSPVSDETQLAMISELIGWNRRFESAATILKNLLTYPEDGSPQ
jgi:hypothetical protein